MGFASLPQRLQALSDSYKTTVSLIQDLQKFPNGTATASDDLDEQRLELANSCHESLKDAEESLELLRQEVDDLDPARARRNRIHSAKDEERERNAATVARLSEDIRAARGAFRRAQLQSKKNLDARKQKEREQLFANRRSGATDGMGLPARQKGQEKLTQDELAQNAAEDVTRALKRTHAMMTSNLQQSQFAQQTLDESQEQLRTLSQQYTGTTDMLQKSRGLVKTLVTSQKSDTWYLQTSVYILLATLTWLIFRRLLYGPLWWLVYLPVRYLWWTLSLILGGASAAVRPGAVQNTTLRASTGLNVPKNTPGAQHNYVPIPPKGAGWGNRAEPDSDVPPGPEEVEKLKQMVKEANDGTSVELDDTDSRSINTKKRMMDTEQGDARIRDEL